jgi:PTH1 family peptidyl-tRNA hydrolase
VGWWLADRLVRAWRLPRFEFSGRTAWTSGRVHDESIAIHKPLTYMNRSGDALETLEARGEFDARTEMLVLVDDVWLPPGRIRIRRSGSAGGHNGLASVEERLGSDEYGRLRIGVGRPHDRRIDLAAWVLAPMRRTDEEAVLAAFPSAVEAVECWLRQGMDAAMNRFNRGEPRRRPPNENESGQDRRED